MDAFSRLSNGKASLKKSNSKFVSLNVFTNGKMARTNDEAFPLSNLKITDLPSQRCRFFVSWHMFLAK